MTVIDAQVHTWGAETPDMDAAGVDYVIIVPPSWEGDRNDLALAQYPNVAVKATSLPNYVTEAYPYPNLHMHIRHVIEAYGPHRVFWGTDLTRLRGSYRHTVTLFTEELDFLSDIDKTMDYGSRRGRMGRLAAVGHTTHCRSERSLMETERPIPQPITPESKPYWDGMKEGKLMLPKCQDCGKVHFYPRVFCPHCHSKNLTWVQGSGKGKLYSFEILYRPFNRAVKVPPPYVLAMVELEEGARMLSNLVNVEPDPKVIKCDMPVEIVFSKLTDDMTIPLFQPAR